jgi:tetratricopeptide (TPR) repeat protein
MVKNTMTKDQRRGLDAVDAFKVKAPDEADTHYQHGVILQRFGRDEEALAALNHALLIDDNHMMAHIRRIQILQRYNEHAEILRSLDKLVTADPNNASLHHARGLALRKLDRGDEAIAAYALAAAYDAENESYHLDLAIMLHGAKRYDEAIESYNRVLALNPANAVAHGNRASLLHKTGRYEEALIGYDQAIHHDPTFISHRLNRALLLLLMGRYDEGWREYEWRLRRTSDDDAILVHYARRFNQPAWSGDDLRGRTLLVHGEQGLGDVIQMLRYVELLADMGAKIVLEIPVVLHSLAQSLAGDISFVVREGEYPPFDCHCPIMSLPLAFGTNLKSIPANIPYLRVAPEKIEEWKARLGRQSRPRIGLVWSGGRQSNIDRWNNSDPTRSIALSAMAPLLLNGETCAEFHSLQIEYRDADMKTMQRYGCIQDHSADLKDISDTAALIEQMDLVISVDTSVAHLAGALGKPVWIMLPHVPDWRWLLDREDSPWYPTARLFRQPSHGDWDSVIKSVISHISEI